MSQLALLPCQAAVDTGQHGQVLLGLLCRVGQCALTAAVLYTSAFCKVLNSVCVPYAEGPASMVPAPLHAVLLVKFAAYWLLAGLIACLLALLVACWSYCLLGGLTARLAVLLLACWFYCLLAGLIARLLV